jgi:purine-binding chemotaxis protein CheW
MTTRKLSTFRLGDALFGVAVEDVQEVTRFHETTPVPLASGAVSGLMNLRGQVVTVLDLRHRLGYPPARDVTSSVNLVVRGDGGAVSLLVDAVEGFHDVRDEELVERPETVQGPARDLVLGAYQLDDELLLALDLQRAIDVEAQA